MHRMEVISAVVAQLGERTTEDRKVRGSNPRDGTFLYSLFYTQSNQGALIKYS